MKNIPLFFGQSKYMKIFRIFLTKNCDLNLKNNSKNTVLHLLLEHPQNFHTDYIKLLIQNKCNVNLQNKFGHCAIVNSIYNYRYEQVKYLLNNGAIISDFELKVATKSLNYCDSYARGNATLILNIISNKLSNQKNKI